MSTSTVTTITGSIPSAPKPRRKQVRPRFTLNLRWGLGVLLPAFLLLVWYIWAKLGLVSPILLPSPAVVLPAAKEMFLEGNLIGDFWESLRVVLQGFAIGGSIGLIFGALCGHSQTVERVFGPTFDALRQIPPVALLSLLVLWFGIGEVAKVVLISKAVFFPVFLNTLQGIRGVQKEYVEVGRVFKLTRWQFARKVIIPGALPSILVGIRYGAGLAWSLVVVAETLSGHVGLGYVIWRAQELLFINQLIVAVIFITLFGLTLDRSLRFLERRLLRWKQGYAG